MELKDKLAVVTGAGQGIGRAIAIELAEAGVRIIANDINSIEGKKVVSEIEKRGLTALFMRADVSKAKEVNKMFRFVLNRFGKIDILVNNAGISPKGLRGKRLQIMDITEEEWEKVMNINVKSVFNCSKAVMKTMMKQRSGKIVNIASIAALMGGGPRVFAGAHYVASKAAVVSFSKTLAVELAPYGVNVNTIAPGRIETDMIKHVLPKRNEKYRKNIPLRRFGRPEEIAKAVAFLVSDSASFITGETLVIDGGVVMH
jgi:3-oxoacyl-[acyl-carrier protein] reductase